jgi:hypothetical protein
VTVSPTIGNLGTRITRSRLTLPTTVTLAMGRP